MIPWLVGDIEEVVAGGLGGTAGTDIVFTGRKCVHDNELVKNRPGHECSQFVEAKSVTVCELSHVSARGDDAEKWTRRPPLPQQGAVVCH